MFGRSLLYVVVGSVQLLVTSLISPALAYLLSPSDFGTVSLTLTIYQLLFIFAVFGFDQMLVVFNAEGSAGAERARRLLASTIFYSFLIAGLFAVSEPLWRTAVGMHNSSGVLLAGVLWVGPSASNAFILALLRAQDRLKWFVAVSLLSAIGGQVLGVLALVVVDRNPTLYAGAGVATQLAGLAIGVIATKPKLHAPLGSTATRAVIRMSAPIAASALAVYVLNTSDRILIARELGEVSVARYQVAYIVGSAVLLLLGLLNGAWLPQLLKLKDSPLLVHVAQKSRDYLMVILLPITLGVVIAAPALLRLVAPSSFGGASLTGVTTVVALSAFPVAHAGASARLLLVRGRRPAIAWAAGAAGLLNVVLNIALIPSMHIFGSALATLIAFVAQAVILSIRAHGWRWTLPPVLSIAVVAVATAGIAVDRLPVSQPWLIGRFAVGALLGILGLALLPRARTAMQSAQTGASSTTLSSSAPMNGRRPLPRSSARRRPLPYRDGQSTERLPRVEAKAMTSHDLSPRWRLTPDYEVRR